MSARAVAVSEKYLARLEYGADQREEIREFYTRKGVEPAWFNAMGAAQDVGLWFYDQANQRCQSVTFDEPLEVATYVGNVALLNGEPFARMHAILSRHSGQAFVGHPDSTTVSAGELNLHVFREPLERDHGTVTDLNLWL